LLGETCQLFAINPRLIQHPEGGDKFHGQIRKMFGAGIRNLYIKRVCTAKPVGIQDSGACPHLNLKAVYTRHVVDFFCNQFGVYFCSSNSGQLGTLNKLLNNWRAG